MKKFIYNAVNAIAIFLIVFVLLSGELTGKYNGTNEATLFAIPLMLIVLRTLKLILKDAFFGIENDMQELDADLNEERSSSP